MYTRDVILYCCAAQIHSHRDRGSLMQPIALKPDYVWRCVRNDGSSTDQSGVAQLRAPKFVCSEQPKNLSFINHDLKVMKEYLR